MKRALTAVAVVILSTSLAHAGLKTVGKKESLAFDPSGFPPDMKTKYEMVKTKCNGCHSLERFVVAINNGVGPITGQIFSSRTMIRGFGCKAKKSTDHPLNKEEVKTALDLANYLIKEAEKP